MFAGIRKHFSYTNIALTLTLVFAMSGGAYAAGKYLVTSTKQISPKVLTALAGKRGPAGPTGASGATGPAGAAGAKGETGAPGKEGLQGKEGSQGKEGPQGKAGLAGKEGSPWTASGTLPSGKGETGAYAVRKTDNAVGELAATAISFAIPLAAGFKESAFIEVGQADPPGCKGTVEKPEALPGNLCVFEGEALAFHMGGLNYYTSLGPAGAISGTTGVEFLFLTKVPTQAGEEVTAEGTWAVTAE